MDLVQWIHRFFEVEHRVKDEYCLTCPSCQKPKLYFNVNKKVGYCQYDKCIYHVNPPKLGDLVEAIGFGPDEAAFSPVIWNETGRGEGLDSPVPATFPELCQPLVVKQGGQLCTSFSIIIDHLIDRDVFPGEVYHFNLQFDGSRVYIPVYFEGKMVSWLARSPWWYENDIVPKYRNCPDRPLGKYLFNWSECKTFPRLTIVENTFNAIGWRESLFTTSSFGSHLSENQAKLIASAPFESVAILWDHGAEKKAEQAVKMLKTEYGVRAAFCILTTETPQPDYLWWKDLSRACERTHGAARAGREWVKIE